MIHPTTTNAEIQYVCDSIKMLAEDHENWGKDYTYNKNSNEFLHKDAQPHEKVGCKMVSILEGC